MALNSDGWMMAIAHVAAHKCVDEVGAATLTFIDDVIVNVYLAAHTRLHLHCTSAIIRQSALGSSSSQLILTPDVGIDSLEASTRVE